MILSLVPLILMFSIFKYVNYFLKNYVDSICILLKMRVLCVNITSCIIMFNKFSYI